MQRTIAMLGLLCSVAHAQDLRVDPPDVHFGSDRPLTIQVAERVGDTPRDLCTTPCDAQLDRGEHLFWAHLSGPRDRAWMGTVSVRPGDRFFVDYDDREDFRLVALWTLLGGLAIGGAGVAALMISIVNDTVDMGSFVFGFAAVGVSFVAGGICLGLLLPNQVDAARVSRF